MADPIEQALDTAAEEKKARLERARRILYGEGESQIDKSPPKEEIAKPSVSEPKAPDKVKKRTDDIDNAVQRALQGK